MMTNKAYYMLGIYNYNLLDGTWDNEELDISLSLNNEGSGLCIGGYDGWYVGKPLCYNQMESNNNVWYLLVQRF